MLHRSSRALSRSHYLCTTSFQQGFRPHKWKGSRRSALWPCFTSCLRSNIALPLISFGLFCTRLPLFVTVHDATVGYRHHDNHFLSSISGDSLRGRPPQAKGLDKRAVSRVSAKTNAKNGCETRMVFLGATRMTSCCPFVSGNPLQRTSISFNVSRPCWLKSINRAFVAVIFSDI